MLVVIDRGQVLLEQRPGTGIWGGLMSLPEVDGHLGVEVEAVPVLDVLAAAGQFGAVDEVQALRPLVHVFTHYKLHIHPWQVRLSERGGATGRHLWWDLDRIGDAPLPAPVKKLLVDLGTPGLFG